MPARKPKEPTLLQSCIVQVAKKTKRPRKGGTPTSAGFGICIASLRRAGHLKSHGLELTRKGKEREASFDRKERAAVQREYERLLKASKKR